MIKRIKGKYKKEFIRFLLRHNCYKEYVFAMSKTCWEHDLKDAENYILSAFDWVSYSYLLSPKKMIWKDLHTYWVEEFEELELERYKKMH